MDETLESIAEIYDAVGNAERWQRLAQRLATIPVSPELHRHLEIARQAHEQLTGLASEVDALMGVHDQLALGALVVAADGRLLRANAAARRMLSERDGLVVENGRVQASHANDNTVLRALLERASAGTTEANRAASPFVVLTRAGLRPLTLLVLRTNHAIAHVFDERPPVVLLSMDAELATEAPAALLRDLFGFTAREAEFATLMMKGLSVEDAARALGVAISTARSFLSQVTAKTETRSQVELMKTLLALPPVT